ncbi:HEAT repeat-containing protein 2 [Habropoda laboriosa]|uniref:Rho GDP-dissociation inhibitor 3 n=1 Tax=Habropoda laboriosa TaxID=597456 RepID=A0A0L7R775_9HYME|nr:HEAT repeat-containing protein 2 [Habropoda laboriosa]
MKQFIVNLTPNDRYIMYLLPTLSKRLGSFEQIETSEEVRLKCVTLLKIIILKYKNLLISYIDDLTKILTHTVADNYPLVKRESCDCISEFANNLPNYFYSQAQNLVKPILNNFTHQHYRVRIASIRTIGDVIQYGNSKSVEEVATPLAEKLFDQHGLVRAATIEIAGCWLLKLRDRYSWWHKILPLLLTGLHDELENIRQKAADFWNAIGQQYIAENQDNEKLKNTVDFLTKDRDHYPNVIRPNLGCRVIAQQSFSKLINGISLELGDWIVDIRIRTAQLLCVFILHIEEDVIQHIGKLLPPMYKACNDEDNRVVENIEKAAEYLGYFVPPQTYCRLIIPTLEETPSTGHLKVFSAILKGSERCKLLPLLEDIGKFIQQPHICQSKKRIYQKQILSCCSSLISTCKEDCKLISKELFLTIFTVQSMAQENLIKLKAQELLNILADINLFNNIEQFYHENISTLFSLLSDYKSWSIHSPECQIFCACLIYIRHILAYNMDTILPILKETMTNDTDPEVRLKYFILLSEYFCQGSLNEIIDLKFSNQFLENCILPGLIWRAGRSAEAIRTATISCLCIFLDKYEKVLNIEKTLYLGEQNISLVLDKIIPVLISLADDNSKKYEYIHKIYPILLKRLDDGCDDVRIISLEALTEVWNAIPENYDIYFNKGHIDSLYTTTIIYLDDPEVEFQNIVLGSLKVLAKIHPQLLYEKLQKCKTNFRNQNSIDILIESLKMSELNTDHVDSVEEELEVESNYKPPPEKTIEQILEADKEDESLRKYKETLLGEAKSGGVVVDPNDPRKVIVKKLALCVADRPDMELDLTGDLSQLKKQTFVIKEGVSYRIRIDFIVQREIVHGLKYVQKTYRLGVPGVTVDKMMHMVGSYPPKTEVQSYTTPTEDAPAGVMARGSYSVSSLFTDDDKHEHLKWEWSFEIKKDWKE